MFSLQKRRHSKHFMDNRYMLNRQTNTSQTFEEPKDSQTLPLEKKLVKFPVEHFSDQVSGVDIIEPVIKPLVESSNSKIVNDISKGIKAEDICSNKNHVPEPIKKDPIDNNFIVTKTNHCINPEVGQKLLHTSIKKSSKKSKKHLTVYDF